MKPASAKKFASPHMYWEPRNGPSWSKWRVKAFGSRTKKAGK